MTPDTSQLIDYILDNMPLEKVLEMPMPSDNEAASELVTTLKQRGYQRLEDLPISVEDPTDEQIAASIVLSLKQVAEGENKAYCGVMERTRNISCFARKLISVPKTKVIGYSENALTFRLYYSAKQ